MRLLPVILLLFLFCTSSTLNAQSYPNNPQENQAVYKAAVGGYYGVINGKDIGVKAKYFVHRSFAAETQLSKAITSSKDVRYYQIYMALLLQPELGNSPLRPFLGLGPALNLVYKHPQLASGQTSTSTMGVLPAGFEYSFTAIPLAVSFDYKINFLELSREHLRRPDADSNTVGFSLKLLFR